MTTLTTLTVKNGIHRAFYSDDTSLIISRNDANSLSKAYNIRIENDDDAATTSIGNRLFSYLTPAELKELRRCVKIAYPTQTEAQRKRQYQTLACHPAAAARFVKHPDFQK